MNKTPFIVSIMTVFFTAACGPPKPVETPLPAPQIYTATMTPTPEPSWDSFRAFNRSIDHVLDTYPQRATFRDLRSAWLEPAEGTDYVNLLFKADDWRVRIYDPDMGQLDSRIKVIISSELTEFRWEGFVVAEEVEGWLTSGGVVPKPAASPGETDKWLMYVNDRYGYTFQYDSDADVIETGVSFFDLDELPEGMSETEYLYELYARYGPNLCVRLELGDGYILFDPPENHSANYTFCRRIGATTATVTERIEAVTIEGVQYLANGDEFEVTDGRHNESLSIDLPSGVRIEFGGYAIDDAGFEVYRQEILPILLAILETYESIPMDGEPT
jgi:hypothetical protein